MIYLEFIGSAIMWLSIAAITGLLAIAGAILVICAYSDYYYPNKEEEQD